MEDNKPWPDESVAVAPKPCHHVWVVDPATGEKVCSLCSKHLLQD